MGLVLQPQAPRLQNCAPLGTFTVRESMTLTRFHQILQWIPHQAEGPKLATLGPWESKLSCGKENSVPLYF